MHMYAQLSKDPSVCICVSERVIWSLGEPEVVLVSQKLAYEQAGKTEQKVENDHENIKGHQPQ